MSHGLSPATVAAIAGVFARFPQVSRAVLYGSRAKGTHKPGSDIDLTLFGEEIDASGLARIASALDDLLLPYMIDLSNHAGIRQADLLDHIQCVGLEFYRRDAVVARP